jgi:phenylacetate-CoA ligase
MVKSNSTGTDVRAGQSLHPARSSIFSEARSQLIRTVVYPRLLKRWRPTAQLRLRELKKSEFVSLEMVETSQFSKLLDVIHHAAQHVPYYRRLFRERGIYADQIQSREDVSRIPVLSKANLQESINDLCAENRDKASGLPNASGGSTGKPVQFFQDADYWDNAYASQWFFESWWGIRPGDRTASLWGADRDIHEQSWKERLSSAIGQIRICNAFALTVPQMQHFAQMLATWQPRHVIGYASALEIFAKFLLEHPEFRIRPIAVKATADVLSDERRRILEEAFDCPVYNFYGSREVNNLAVECPAREGMHVNGWSRYIEIVDDDGRAVPPGVPGRILLTDLTNYFMPLLRYEIEDIGTWSGTPCSCGRPFPLIAKIWGRSSDFIVTPEGKSIHSVFFTHLFYDMPDVALFQINQKDVHNVDVYLVLRPGLQEYPAALLHERLRQAFGADVSFTVQVVPKIDRPPSGKHRFTVSSVRAPWGPSAQTTGLQEVEQR